MKTKLFLSLMIIPVLTGCELLKEANTIEIPTELIADVPVVVVEPGKKSVDLTAELNAISFTKSYDLTLASNEDIEPYLSKIKEIDLNSLVITVNGLNSYQTINSISLDVTGVGNIFTQNNISMTSNFFTPVIATGKLDQVAAKLTADRFISLTLSGSASGPMTFTVNLNFETVVIAKAL
jgi:hypothetical protein